MAVKRANRKTTVTKKPDLMTSSLRAIKAAYTGDPTSPGLVLSLLASGEWYVSICRYGLKYGEGKTVVFAAKAISWESALKQVMTQFLNESKIYDTLRRAIS